MDTYLTFKLGNELFAVPVTQVLEVLQKQQITKVPKTADHILGIINFRGDILTVIDTRRRFGMEGSGIENQKIIIVFGIIRILAVLQPTVSVIKHPLFWLTK